MVLLYGLCLFSLCRGRALLSLSDRQLEIAGRGRVTFQLVGKNVVKLYRCHLNLARSQSTQTTSRCVLCAFTPVRYRFHVTRGLCLQEGSAADQTTPKSGIFKFYKQGLSQLEWDIMQKTVKSVLKTYSADPVTVPVECD